MAIDPATGGYRLGSGPRGGGLSGPAIHPVAVRAVHDVHAALPDLPIVGVGGVASGADAAELLWRAPAAVQVGTATFADPRAPLRVLQELADLAAPHPVTKRSVRCVGAAHRREIQRMTVVDTAASAEVRSKLAVALDVDDSVAALRLAREVQPWFGVAKVGLELYSASAPTWSGPLIDLGLRRVLRPQVPRHPDHGRAGGPGGRRARRHLPQLPRPGGRRMLPAGVDGFLAGAAERRSAQRRSRSPSPSSPATATRPPHILQKRVQAALEAGCGGIVCAAGDVHEAKQYGPRLTAVVPGIRPAGTPTHDQARSATPEAAIAAGADLLVIGRAVTHADDPAAAASRCRVASLRIVPD